MHSAKKKLNKTGEKRVGVVPKKAHPVTERKHDADVARRGIK